MLFRHPANFFALGFGSGLAPFAPGTFGTLAGIPIFLLLTEVSTGWYWLALVTGFLIGIPICEKAMESLRDSGHSGHDHPCIVWDEIVGFLLTMLLIPVSVLSVVLGFLVFRLFDILKPWPIRVIDRKVKGGFGIMIDDIVAAVFANLLLRGILFLFP